MGEIRVVLADDHPALRDGIRNALSKAEDLVLVGEAADGEWAQQLCLAEQPDILLLDLYMPGPSATETIVWVQEHSPQTKIVVLTAHDDADLIRDVVDAGIAGYVLKDEATQVIVEAVRKVAAGDTWFSQAVVPKLIHAQQAAAKAPEFTPRELEVLQLMVRGDTDEAIATALGISPRTVQRHLRNIYDKLHVESRIEAAVTVAKLGLLDVD